VQTRGHRGPLRARHALDADGAEHAQAVAHRIEVALAVHALALEARDLVDDEAGLRHADVHERLDLEPVAVDVDVRQAARPERVVAVAEVGVARPVQRVHQEVEPAIAEPTGEGDVRAVAALGEARALHEVGAVDERGHEARDLRRVGRAIGVQHHDDLARGGLEARPERIPLATARLFDDDHVRSQRAGDIDGAVRRVPVDDDDLVEVIGQLREDVREVLRLVEGRDDRADGRRLTGDADGRGGAREARLGRG
jgi:hypothetical protein